MQQQPRWLRKTKMKVKPLKIKIKEPTPSAADRMYAKHQAIRKAKGLPDPSEYKKKLDSMKTEDVEQLDELSKKTLSSYANKAIKDKSGKDRGSGVFAAAKRLYGGKYHMEDVEHLDEISSETKASYKSKAQAQVKEMQPWTKKGEYKDLAKNIIAKRKKGIAKVSEETVQEQLYKKGRFVSGPGKKPFKAFVQAAPQNEETIQEGRPSQRHPLEGHEYHKKSDEALIHIAKDAHAAAEAMKGHNTQAENKYRDQANDSATVRHFRKKNGMPDWYKKKYGHVKEETELTEAKDKREYDYEGDMAQSQLRSLIYNAQDLHDMLGEDSNLPEWLQSKITLAEDYVSTAANYMRSELSEEVKPPTGGLKDACWKGYTAVGMKMKNGRKVPNCVPVKEESEEPSMAARTLSRKAQIVKNAARSKKEEKEEASDKFQKDPELSSDIHKT
jgi:hypothetical protein